MGEMNTRRLVMIREEIQKLIKNFSTIHISISSDLKTNFSIVKISPLIHTSSCNHVLVKQFWENISIKFISNIFSFIYNPKLNSYNITSREKHVIRPCKTFIFHSKSFSCCKHKDQILPYVLLLYWNEQKVCMSVRGF